MKCPYDEQQCSYPKCIQLGLNTDTKCFEINSLFSCSQCQFTCDKSEIEKIIDHIYGHSPIDGFGLTREKAQALYNFLFANGYISYEFHPLVHEIIKDLTKYLGDKG